MIKLKKSFYLNISESKEKEIYSKIKNSILNDKINRVLISMHIISSKKVFIQLLNNCDEYFSYNCQDQLYSFQKGDELKYKILEYEFNGTAPLNSRDKALTNKENIEFSIKPFDFKLFLIEFE